MKFIFLSLFLLSCTVSGDQTSKLNTDVSSVKGLEENRNMIAIDMGNLNSRMRAKLILEEKYKDFEKLSLAEYLKKANHYQIPSEKEYIEYLTSTDLEIVMASKGKVFSVCSKSRKMKLVFCDKSDTAAPEFSGTDISLDLEEEIKKYI